MYRDQRAESAGLWGSLQTDWRSGCFLGAEGTGVPGGYGSEQWSQDFPSVGTPSQDFQLKLVQGKKVITMFYFFDFRGGCPGGSEDKASAYNAEDPGSIPEWGRSLEKEMATHSSTLAWRIPWTEESGRIQSLGSRRVGHDWESSRDFTFHVDSILKSHHSNDVMGAFTQSEASTGKSPSIFHHHNYLCVLSR